MTARLTMAVMWVVLGTGAAAAQQGMPEILQRTGIDQRLDEQVPLDLTFRDEAGSAVQLRSYFGDKPVILSLVYYECPMLCTLVLNGLVSSLRTMSLDVGRDFEVVTLSFDARETPELAAAKMATYLEQYRRPGAAEGWHFLTGEAAAIEALARAVGFRWEWDEQTQQFAHAAGLVVLTPEGRVSRYFYGVEYPPRDLRLGLVEASENRIGTIVDAVLLYCFHWDPLTGRYSRLTMNAVRAGGIVTVLAMAGFILGMLRRDRAPRPRPLPPPGAREAEQQ
jgi:protein SCO1/2